RDDVVTTGPRHGWIRVEAISVNVADARSDQLHFASKEKARVFEGRQPYPPRRRDGHLSGVALATTRCYNERLAERLARHPPTRVHCGDDRCQTCPRYRCFGHRAIQFVFDL